jgi:hypothetical protein
MTRALVLATCVGALSCGLDPAPYESAPLPDPAAFEAVAQPVLLARCANPTTCHGREDRPLALYAPWANRMDPADLLRDKSLTAAEVRANYDRARAFALERASGPLLLTKPLAESAGGAWHGGDDLFESREDREYRALESWIRGE